MKLFSFFLFFLLDCPLSRHHLSAKERNTIECSVFFLIIPLDFSRCLLLSRQVCFFINYYYQAACCPSITERKNTFFSTRLLISKCVFFPLPPKRQKKETNNKKYKPKEKKKKIFFFPVPHTVALLVVRWHAIGVEKCPPTHFSFSNVFFCFLSVDLTVQEDRPSASAPKRGILSLLSF